MKNTNKIKNRYRFNIIDVLLLLVIVFSIAAIAFLFFYDGNSNTEKTDDISAEIIYTVEQKNLPDILRGKINMGDSVVDAKTGEVLGQVIDFQYTDSMYDVYDNETNTTKEAVYPGKIDVTVKISTSAVLSENGTYKVGKQTLNVGEQLDLRFPFYIGKAVCTSLSGVSK